MSKPVLNQRWGGPTQLLELFESQDGGQGFVQRDFALVTIAGQLAVDFPGQMVFKGGFALRHAHGHLRFSKDVDATRHGPPKHKFEPGDVAESIRNASITNVVHFAPGDPETDSKRSLDFGHVSVSGELVKPTTVQVEVSYREEVLAAPVSTSIGEPYYEPFEIFTMDISEMAAEKLRALAQRDRPTDLADLAAMVRSGEVDVDASAAFASAKFEIVKGGNANRIERVEAHIRAFADSYDDVVPQTFLDAPTYDEAVGIVRPLLARLLP